MKPAEGAQGRGVSVFNKWRSISSRHIHVVQHYIAYPLLLENGSKFDIRVYVYVSSYYPLRVYVHEEMLIRLATKKYTLASNKLEDVFVHLTNSAINQNHHNYSVKDYKWSSHALWSALESMNVDCDEIWSSICAICVKSVASIAIRGGKLVERYCKSPYQVHQLLGFDLLIDKNHKVWLLEVNNTPSLSGNSAFDMKLKSTILTDFFNVAGIRAPVLNNTEVRPWGQKHRDKLSNYERSKQEKFSHPTLDIWAEFSVRLSIDSHVDIRLGYEEYP
ncbi:Tubulin polyglutamylase ttll4 [Cichlidogyrus casuarinus]|uniref:Tubulin polyglutamylase ttll4 n=1 Tax=Cichlidogyrus casuarinus TaxID=1844966 RepID=A0ABD2Q9S1_9PLAT